MVLIPQKAVFTFDDIFLQTAHVKKGRWCDVIRHSLLASYYRIIAIALLQHHHRFVGVLHFDRV